MSINFLDIKYVIIFSLVQYSTAVVLKSPKYYTSIYIKKQSKTNLYIHNPYKARKNNDYNYKDWEEKKQDVYDYLLSSTNRTSTTASKETSPQKSLYTGTLFAPTIPMLESSQYSSSATYPTLPSTESTPDTSLPTPSTVSTPLSIFPSFSTPYNITTTTLTQVVSTVNITIVTTTLTSPVINKDTRGQYIRDEIQEAKEKLRAGVFTASIYVIFKLIEKKKATDVTSLLNGLQVEVARLNTNHHLAMFGPTVNSVFTFIVLNMATAPIDLIQTQAKNGQEVIENRKYSLELDTRTIFDLVDAIYIEEDYHRIVEALTDIHNFPNVSNNEIKIAEQAIEAFILKPYQRIEGTAKEKLLVVEIHTAVAKRMATDENKSRDSQRGNFRKHVEINTERTASSVNITKFKAKKITKASLRINLPPLTWPTFFTETTTINSSLTDFTSYVTDPNILKRLKHKMIIYKNKIREIKVKEGKLKTKRGPTSTTIRRTRSTVKPTMHRSKYYWRKYVKKDLYKMKKSTPITTKFLWKYYGKLKTIRRFMAVEKFEMTKFPLSHDSSDIDDYYSDSDENDYTINTYKSNDVTKSMSPIKFKSLSRFNTNKNDITDIINSEESKTEIQDSTKTLRSDNKPDSSDSNAEAYLKLKLNDALFHTHNITIDRRFMKKKINKLNKMDSFSDDEAILKGNIYKAFGYSNDFAKQLRTMH